MRKEESREDPQNERQAHHGIIPLHMPDRRDLLDALVILGTSLLAFIIRAGRLSGYSGEDDSAYVAACGLILKGYEPHRDFFLAHPPGFFYFTASLWRLMALENPETMWQVAKTISFLSFLGVGIVLYLLCRNILKNRVAGLLALLIYQLSSQSLQFSTACAPQLPATFLIVVSVYLLLDAPPKTRGRFFILGSLLGLALVTRLSALYLLPTVLLYSALESRQRGTGGRELAFALVGFLIPPLAVILTAPLEKLWFDLVLFHFLKGEATIGAKIEKFLSILANREFPHLFGLVSAPYTLTKRDARLNLLLGQGILLLGPYFMQATSGAHVLIESSPFFAVLSAITLSETAKSVIDKRRTFFTVCLSILLASTTIIGVPPTLATLSETIQETAIEGRVYRKLVKIVERETDEEDTVFSQIPIVPFLAGRNYPPFIDTSQEAATAGIYSSETVKDLIIRYEVRLLIVRYRIGDELSDFLRSQGFAKVENLGGYWVYIRDID